MKSIVMIVAGALLIGVAGFAVSSPALAQGGYGMHHGMWGEGDGWSYCPYCGSRLEGRRGYGMGPGMMDPGYDRRGEGYGMWGPGYGQRRDDPYEGRARRYREPLDREGAGDRVQDMLRRSKNPNLKLGDMEDQGDYFVADILTRDGALVDKLQIDKDTGMMRSVY